MYVIILGNRSSVVKSVLRSTLTKFIERGISSSGSDSHYDIIIAGGGMVGTTLACTLGKF